MKRTYAILALFATLLSGVAYADGYQKDFGWGSVIQRVDLPPRWTASKQKESCPLEGRTAYLLSKQRGYADHEMPTVEFRSDGVCRLVPGTGQWYDNYAPRMITGAENFDVDHIVSLKEAWESGASSWSREKRVEFAHDTDNLTLTEQSINRRKGALPVWEYLKWYPEARSDPCTNYVGPYIEVKRKYDLSFSKQEIAFFKSQIDGTPGAKLYYCKQIKRLFDKGFFGGWSVDKTVKVR